MKEEITKEDWIKIYLLFASILVVVIYGVAVSDHWAESTYYVIGISFVSYLVGYVKGKVG